MEVGKSYIFKHIIGAEPNNTEELYRYGEWGDPNKINMRVTHNGNRNGTGTVQSAEIRIKNDPPITVNLDAIIIGKKPPKFIEISVKSNGLVIGSLPIDYFKGNNSADIWKYENAALGRSQSQSQSQSKSRIQSGGRIASPKSVKYSPTSRTILKTINGVSRERKVWLNKEKKEFVRVTVNGKLVFKKV